MVDRAIDALNDEQRAELERRIYDAENCTGYDQEMALLLWLRDELAKRLNNIQVMGAELADVMADEDASNELLRDVVAELLEELGIEIPEPKEDEDDDD